MEIILTCKSAKKAEIDLENTEHLGILNASQFFNPVDLVCFVKDYKEEKYNLLDYINVDRYFISEKTFKGKKTKSIRASRIMEWRYA